MDKNIKAQFAKLDVLIKKSIMQSKVSFKKLEGKLKEMQQKHKTFEQSCKKHFKASGAMGFCKSCMPMKSVKRKVKKVAVKTKRILKKRKAKK